MEIILREDIENLGLAYDVVSVKPGFARNFLIPEGKAVLATAKEKENLSVILTNLAKEEASQIKEAQDIVAKLKETTLSITSKAGASGKLFGSINNANLTEQLGAKGIAIEKKYIKVPGNSIKRAGSYVAKIRLHREVEYDFEFEIIGDVEKVEKPKEVERKVVVEENSFANFDNPLYDKKPEAPVEAETPAPVMEEAKAESAGEE